MTRKILRTIYLILTVFVGLITLPFLINIATGGTLPEILRPYEGYVWPALWGAAGVVIAVPIYEYFSTTRKVRPRPRVPTHPNNRKYALAQIRKVAEERLSKSLARIALDLRDRPDSVAPLLHLMVQGQKSADMESMKADNIRELFQQFDQSMLVLGQPGSGKTTILLDLLMSLLDEADQDLTQPIPVFLELSYWAANQDDFNYREAEETVPTPAQPENTREYIRRNLLSTRPRTDDLHLSTGDALFFHDWIKTELVRLYGVPFSVSDLWLESRNMVLLIDGLDEVPKALRDRCVEAINELQDDYKVPSLAISSRVKDYEQLRLILALRGAIEIEPLSRAQVETYLSDTSPRLARVREALERDPTLWTLLDSPLFLNIMLIAYGDETTVTAAVSGSIEHRRMKLFDSYFSEVVTRRRAPAATYHPSQTKMWLANLAHCGRAGKNVLPIRRIRWGTQWSMSWQKCIPVPYTAMLTRRFLPSSIGLSLAIGSAWPAAKHLGAIGGYIALSFIALGVTFLIGCLNSRSVAAEAQYVESSKWLKWRAISAGSVYGISSGAISYWISAHSQQILPWSAFWEVATGLGITVLLATVVLFLEPRLPPGLIEWAWWAVLALGAATISVLVLLEDTMQLVRAGLIVGLLATLCAATPCLIGVYSISSEKWGSWYGMLPGRAAFLAAIVLCGISVITFIAVDGMSNSVDYVTFIGFVAGITYGLLLAFIISRHVCAVALPFNWPLAIAGALPWRLKKFLDYAADRTLLVESNQEYRFLHGLLQEYFLSHTLQDVQRPNRAGRAARQP